MLMLHRTSWFLAQTFQHPQPGNINQPVSTPPHTHANVTSAPPGVLPVPADEQEAVRRTAVDKARQVGQDGQ